MFAALAIAVASLLPGPDYATARMLLESPVGSPAIAPPYPAFNRLRAAIHEIAIREEWMDAREASYLVFMAQDFEADVNTLRCRRQELADAPHTADAGRFPPKELLGAAITFNRAYRSHLIGRIDSGLEPHRERLLREAVRECDYCYAVYDSARDAKAAWYYASVRRRGLMRLRELIGEDAYLRADLGPSVPLHRFEDLR